jgi:MoaA/NifB/PqqE/SkfB family radical SAM enzyme
MFVSRLLRSLRPVPGRAAPSSVLGGIDELSDRHVTGWAFDRRDPAARVTVEALLDVTGEVLARTVADQFAPAMAAVSGGDGRHGFYARWPRPLTSEERGHVRVRPAGAIEPLPRAGWVRDEFNPLMHVAMDIVDNCNLRCPFCLYDYAHTHATNTMDEKTLAAALRFLPYTRDGEFWFSCLHEPTLHPNLQAFVDLVPREYRRKIFFTTNLAKRMRPSYFAWLASSGLHHVNISIESRDPAIYERMRAGARHRIFAANWDALLEAFAKGGTPPRLHYIAMAYKSNFRELPDMVAWLLAERQADHVELRYTYDVPHIPPEFRQAEFLAPDEWFRLRDRLAHFAADRVRLVLPPDLPATASAAAPNDAAAAAPPPAAAPASGFVAGRYMFRLSWDGALRLRGVLASSRGEDVREQELLAANIREVADPAAFFEALDAAAPAWTGAPLTLAGLAARE